MLFYILSYVFVCFIKFSEGQCRLTCLQTDNGSQPSSFSNIWSPSSLVFILDTTQSMLNELQLVRREVNGILQVIDERARVKACKPVDNYIIFPFNDPYIGPMYRSTTVSDFESDYAEVETQVKGGGDCPEPVLTAILTVLDNITENSFVFIFTDGAAKDARKKLQVIRAIQQTNSFVVFVMIGDHCSNEGLDYIGTQLYDQISHASGGNSIFVRRTPETVGSIVKLIGLFVKPKSVSLIDLHQFEPSDCLQIPVDGSLCDLVITVRSPFSQNIGRASLHSPGSDRKVPHDVRTRSVKAWEIDGPRDGNWRLCFGRNRGRKLSLQVRGSSDIDVKARFRNAITRIELTEVRGGELVELRVQIFGTSTTSVETIEFIDLEGKVLNTLSAFSTHVAQSYITIPGVRLPSGIFKIRVKGTYNSNTKFQRLSSTLYGQPDEPTWVIKPPRNVYALLNTNSTIEAVVTGEPTPILVWEKDDEVIHPSNEIQIFREGTLVIARVTDTDAGSYRLTATNQAGTISTEVELSIWTAPYFTREPQTDRIGQLNRPVLIDLDPQGTPPPTCRWTHKGREVSVIGQCSHHIPLLNDRSCGEYMVVVENNVASISRTFKVTFRPVCNLATCHFIPPGIGSSWPILTNCIACPARCEWTHNSARISTSNKYSIHKNCSLIVRDFEISDQGRYELNLYDNSNNDIADREVIRVIPQQELRIIEPNLDRTLAQVNTEFEVLCKSTGFPLPTLTWSREDRPLRKAVPLCNNDTDISLPLRFDRILKRDEGRYKCTATNRFEIIAREIRISVNSTINVEVRIETPNIVIGECVFMHCLVTNRGQLPATVNWYNQGNNVIERERITIFPNNSLKFSPVLGEDTGNYECRALTTLEITADYTELEATPRTVYFNPLSHQTVCLECPQLAGANINWRKNRDILVNGVKYSINVTERELCIRETGCEDESSYICNGEYSIPVRLRDSEQICEHLVLQRPRFHSRQPGLIIKSGETATLTCQVTGVPEPRIQWFRNRNEELVDDPRATLQLSSSYTQGDSSFVYQSVVTISDIRLEDQGRYSCNASYPGLGYANHTFPMQVTLPDNADRPHFTEKSENEDVCEGEEFSIYCKFNSTLDPVIFRWYFQSTQLIQSEDISIDNEQEERMTTLTIRNSPTYNTGSYTCEASNILGRARNYIHVRVSTSNSPIVEYFTGNTTVYLGQSSTLHCRAAHSVSPVAVRWYKEGGLVGEGEELEFETVNSNNAGAYTCRLSRCGHVIERKLYLEVRGSFAPQISFISPEQTVIDEDPAVLHCIATGDPPPKITWKRGTRELNTNRRIEIFNNGTLLIKEAYSGIDDSEEYVCEAENTEGSTQRVTSLQVIYPVILFIARIVVDPGGTVTSGSRVTLDCVVEGVPVEEFGWYFNGNILSSEGEIEIDSTRRLIIQSFTASFSGEYKCVVANRNTPEISKTVRIYIQS